MFEIDVHSNVLSSNIFIDEEFVGSGVPFLHEGKNYIITSGHVVYGVDFDRNLDKETIIEVVIDNKKFVVKDVIGDIKTSKECEVSILVLESKSIEDINLIDIKFCDRISNELLIENCRLVVKPIQDDQESVIVHKLNDKPLNDYGYYIRVEKDTFHDIKNGDVGASAYAGVSGSGLFYCAKDKLYLAGIIDSIPNVSLSDGLVQITNTKHLHRFLNDVEVTSCLELSQDTNALKEILDKCTNQVNDATIDSWIASNSNEREVKQLNKKTSYLFPEDFVDNERRKIVWNYLSGNLLKEYWSIARLDLSSAYQCAYKVASNDSMIEYFNTRKEASEKYKSICNRHKSTMSSTLVKKGASVVESNLVSNRDIAQWLLICDLAFIDEANN
ncbi:hypothetical protein [Vibrio sp. Vb0888]|uniref:hypothetical protein n=1 Tax=Vibrio sp. Vb0888 TaxID=3074632 RepID=UPI00296536EB|nr:hypothetical protein [Vibrio sp. Vb0888]MDW1850338.1 hypothetical protein [Vibrio sp. Vb0888]